MWQAFLTVLAIVGVCLLYKKTNFASWLKEKIEGKSKLDPKITNLLLIVLGVVLIDIIIWRWLPVLWAVVCYRWDLFIIFNLGVVAVLFLPTLRAKNAKGEETDNPHVTSRVIMKVILVVLVAGIAFVAHKVWGQGLTATKEAKYESLREGIIKALRDEDSPLISIGECNSGLRHYELDLEERKTPEDWEVRVDSQGRIGIFAIPESLLPEAAGLNLNVYNFEQNVRFAKYLWKRYGGLYWLESSDCWGPLVGKFNVAIYVPAEGRTPVYRWPMHYAFDRNVKPERNVEFFYAYSNGADWHGIDGPGVVKMRPSNTAGGIIQGMWFAPVGGQAARITIEVRAR